MQLMEQVALQWEEDEERFRKLQLSDLSAFNDRLDSLTVCPSSAALIYFVICHGIFSLRENVSYEYW
jgi:hypothetical protein